MKKWTSTANEDSVIQVRHVVRAVILPLSHLGSGQHTGFGLVVRLTNGQQTTVYKNASKDNVKQYAWDSLGIRRNQWKPVQGH